MMEQIIEPITMVQSISGPDVIQDIADRLVESLSRECHLQPTDAYESYAAVLTVEIQLRAIDSVKVTKKFTIGNHDPASPSRRLEIDVPLTTADEVRERTSTEPESLERAVVGNAVAPVKKKQPRYYTPRNSIPRVAS